MGQHLHRRIFSQHYNENNMNLLLLFILVECSFFNGTLLNISNLTSEPVEEKLHGLIFSRRYISSNLFQIFTLIFYQIFPSLKLNDQYKQKVLFITQLNSGILSSLFQASVTGLIYIIYVCIYCPLTDLCSDQLERGTG